MKWHVQPLLAAAAIDDRTGPDHDRARGPRHVHRLSRRAAGRDDVFDDEDPFTGVEREPAPQRQRAVLALREDRADAESAADFLADHDPAERGRQHRLRAERSDDRAKRGAERLGLAWMLQHERALQIAGAVQSGRQTEVPFEKSAGLSKNCQNFGFSHRFASISG